MDYNKGRKKVEEVVGEIVAEAQMNKTMHEQCPFKHLTEKEINSLVVKKQMSKVKSVLTWISSIFGILLFCGTLMYSAGVTGSKINETRTDLDKFISATDTRFITVERKLDEVSVAVTEIKVMAGDVKDIKEIMFRSFEKKIDEKKP